MKNYKTKFLKVFLPCASLILAEIILVLLIQWVLFDKHTGESRYINNIWLAFTVGIAGSIISYYFTKKLKVSNKENYNGKGDWRLVFALLTGYFFGLTMCCENVISDDRFMRLAISDIRIIKNIDEIDTEYIDDYYYLDNLKIDTNAIVNTIKRKIIKTIKKNKEKKIPEQKTIDIPEKKKIFITLKTIKPATSMS